MFKVLPKGHPGLSNRYSASAANPNGSAAATGCRISAWFASFTAWSPAAACLSRCSFLASSRSIPTAPGCNYLSTRGNSYTRGIQLGGGYVVDWLPDEDGAVLMTRTYLPDDHTGSRIGSSKRGTAVDRVDTQTLAAQTIEQPRDDAVAYISDGRGTIRVMGTRSRRGALGDYDSGNIAYYYRHDRVTRLVADGRRGRRGS